jgi:polyhydroxybutyrate depolymerase
MALIRNAGFKFVRADLGWRWTEPRKDAEDWTLADQWLAAADANGIRVILTLDYNNPLWSGAADDKVGLNTQANRDAYARWCERAARHFKNRNVIWEVWNEPNHTPFWKPGPNVEFYADSAKLAYAAVRRAGNDPVLVGAATFCDKNVVDQNTPNNGLTFLNNCFARGALDAADGITVHSYRPGQSQASGRPESVLPFYAALNGVMDTFGKRRPIVSGEWGYSRTEVNEQTQAKYLARSFLVNSLAGIPLSIHYNYSDPGTDVRDREQNFGIVGYSNNPRKLWPAFYAARMVNSVINGSVLQSKMVTNQGRNFLLTYVGPAGTTFVAWTIDGTQTINPVIVNGGYTVRDYLGRPLPNYTGGGLKIDDGPKYLQRLAPKATATESPPAPAAKPEGDQPPAAPPTDKPATDTQRTALRSEPAQLSTSEPAESETGRVVDFKRTFPMGGKQRTYELHLPPVEADQYPCVIVLHGGGSNATQAKVQTLMAPCGDRNGFAVCFPNGTAGYGTSYTWNSGACCGYALNRQVDDVAFLAAVIDDMVARYGIDPSRVYLTGMSNGAQMAWHAGCALAGNKVAAFSAVASTASIPEIARAPIPIMQISGLKDPNAPFLGGIGTNSINQFYNLSTPEMVTRAAQFNNCKFPPTVSSGGNYTKTEYAPTSSSGPAVVMYVLPEGGHTWPGGIDITPKLGTGLLVKDFNANQIMWDFFKKARL